MRVTLKKLIQPTLFLLVMLATSCQNELLPVPTGTKVQTSRSLAPDHLTASQGREKIYLTWSMVEGAQRYLVYASDLMTPTESSFKLVTHVPAAETPSCQIDVKPGTEAWYRVSAILANGKETVPCDSVLATSLAVPEITAIETDSSDATKISVYWNMSNCRNNTYRRQTEYEIVCTNAQDSSNFVKSSVRATDLGNTQYTVTGLQAHSSYKIKIIARTELGDEAESAELSAETLHQLQPPAPLMLEASRGTSKDKIQLSFVLPEKADIQLKEDGTFEQVPLLFAVYRKASSESDDKWKELTDNAELLDEKGQKITAANYPEDGGLTVYWADSSSDVVRGIMYDYKVQSKLDLSAYTSTQLKNYIYIETSKTVSCANASGWRLALPLISTKGFIQNKLEEDSTTYDSASVGFSMTWNNFILDSDTQNRTLASRYQYLLYETFTPFDCDKVDVSEGTKFLKDFASTEELSQFVRNFNLSIPPKDGGERGIYSYTVYIVSSELSSPFADDPASLADVFDSATVATPLTVSDNAGSIKDFTVTGGYKDKFLISWTAESGMNYDLTYSESKDGIHVSSDVPVALGSLPTSGTVNVESSAESGVTRTYRLTATPDGGTASPISNTSAPVDSLGTPDPKFSVSEISYDSITVSWKEVLAAKSYSIKMKNGTDIPLYLEGDEKNVEVTQTLSGDTYYSYTFLPEALGDTYRNASQSGEPIPVTVRATSEVSDFTDEIVWTRTLGPATEALSATVAQFYNSITVEWNEVEGARGYQLVRMRYQTDGSKWTPDEDDYEQFYIDADSLSVSSNGENYSAMTVTRSGTKLTLVDTQKDIPQADKETASQSAITQSRISWGIKIEYMVLPLLSEKDSFDGKTLSSSSLHGEKKLSLTSTDFISKAGSTVGYGLNVRASKAESSQYIEIEWDKPYAESVNVMPLVYRKISGSSDSREILQSSRGLSKDTVSHQQACSTSNEKTKPWEYSVRYTSSTTQDSYSEASPFAQSYIDALQEEVVSVTGDKYEPKAVGYLFYLPYFSVNNVPLGSEEGFTESVNWSKWNYSERANGPEDDGDTPAYTVWAKNKNNSSAWFQIASMTADGTVSAMADPGWYETDIANGKESVTLTPKDVSNESGCNNGLLKVQRDYKHYYMIRAQRKNSEGKIIYTYIGLDESVWTYRRISAEEFAKCVLLILADAINQSGVSSGGDRTCVGEVGTFKITHRSATKNISYGTVDSKPYQHKFYDLPGFRNSDYISCFTVTIPYTGESTHGADSSKAYYFSPVEITVTHESSLSSYSGTLSFTAGGRGSGLFGEKIDTIWSVTANATTGTASKSLSCSENETQFKTIFPFGLGQNYDSKVKTYDSSRPPYHNNWWLIRAGGTESDSFKLEEE